VRIDTNAQQNDLLKAHHQLIEEMARAALHKAKSGWK